MPEPEQLPEPEPINVAPGPITSDAESAVWVQERPVKREAVIIDVPVPEKGVPLREEGTQETLEEELEEAIAPDEPTLEVPEIDIPLIEK